MTPPDLRLYDLAEAAEILHVTESWLMRQLRERRLAGRKVSRRWMLTEADLRAAIESMASPAIAARPDPAGLTRTSRRNLTRRRAGAA
ncbi:helix-turn-helix domain-containing protein [Nocardia puris]|uniref:helix-turn-helix domain-containing protein n=1 Tax=Nocardia puris TaxID=208602 RepID=UPI0018959CA8|nr:helix-turn-helix domain-containing protein [Nocardia puris]MBF6368376.1 helix-turn-helix domain-containing protein [Nocardia puris]